MLERYHAELEIALLAIRNVVGFGDRSTGEGNFGGGFGLCCGVAV